MPISPDLPSRLKEIRSEIRDEYLQPHAKPWIVGFSGGKDSTLVAQLVFEALLNVSPQQRERQIHIVSNDTLVESPVYQANVEVSLGRIREGAEALRLPIEVVQTRPVVDETFWVSLLGRGYPAPNRTFRWCTDRMKIRPTTRFIREKVAENGGAILLMGVRRAESAARAQRADSYAEDDDGKRLNPHNKIKDCFYYRPILDLSNEDVWQVLLAVRPPWGGTHRELVTLYRNAKGGECPFVLSDDDAPSCGTTSARFGCWTCTVVKKDNSIDGLIDAGFEHLEPLAEFRDRLRELSDTPEYRSKVRRTGEKGLGPLTIEARQMLLGELLEIQEQTGLPLISEHEVRLIRDWWGRDTTTEVFRETGYSPQLATGATTK